jgi:hypothetical protein
MGHWVLGGNVDWEAILEETLQTFYYIGKKNSILGRVSPIIFGICGYLPALLILVDIYNYLLALWIPLGICRYPNIYMPRQISSNNYRLCRFSTKSYYRPMLRAMSEIDISYLTGLRISRWPASWSDRLRTLVGGSSNHSAVYPPPTPLPISLSTNRDNLKQTLLFDVSPAPEPIGYFLSWAQKFPLYNF